LLAHSPFPQPSPNSSRPSLLLSLFCARADPAFPAAHLSPPPASRPSDPVASRSVQRRGLPYLPLPYHTAHAAAQLTASPPYAPLQPRSPIPAWPLPTATQHASLLPSWARKSATATARSRFPPHPSPAPRLFSPLTSRPHRSAPSSPRRARGTAAANPAVTPARDLPWARLPRISAGL